MVRNWSQLPKDLQPIVQYDGIFVAPEMAMPVPGFLVVGSVAHVESLDGDLRMSDSLLHTAVRIRAAMRTALRIHRVAVVHEEIPTSNAHVHICLIPLPDELRILSGDLAAYLRTFQEDDTYWKTLSEQRRLLLESLSGGSRCGA